MNKSEVEKSLKVLAEMWPVPMTKLQTRMYGEALAFLPAEPVESLLRTMLYSGDHEFRPSIGAILAPFKADALEQASADFKAVLGVIWRPVGERDGHLSPRAAEAVSRMGGWSVIGQWEQDARHHQLREFTRVWDEVTEADTAKRLRSVASPVSAVVASLAGAKGTKPEPVAELPAAACSECEGAGYTRTAVHTGSGSGPDEEVRACASCKPQPSVYFMDGLTEKFKAMLKGDE